MRLNWTCAVAAILALGSVSPALAQDFQLRGPLSTGQMIEVKGINGEISATPSSSGNVEVVGTKRAGRRGNPADVRVETVPSSRGITICAVYPAPPGREPNRCATGDDGRM